MLALEPEAASLYCMYLPIHKDSDNSNYGVFKSGEKYMVVDAGGIITYLNCLSLNTFNVFDFKLLFISI